MPRLVCISDTHTMLDKVKIPDGDILLHAGDSTFTGTEEELKTFNDHIGSLPHKHKIFVAGNHEIGLEQIPEFEKILTNMTYLKDSGVTLMGLDIWGSPWQPWFHDWAFNLKSEKELAEYFDRIPRNTHVLVTHSPPQFIMDTTPRGEAVGSSSLLKRLKLMKRIKLHVFGHIHGCYGELERYGIHFVNASICDEQYRPVNKPIVIDV